MYQCKLEKFEGPMDLLLTLIEDEKLDITEISLAHVADQYLEYVKNNEKIQLENLADFLAIASRLILIKSRTLLPTLELSDGEEEEIKDLEQQLREYKKFKEASLVLGKILQLDKICYSREGFSGVRSIFYPPENVNMFDIKRYFLAVLSEIPLIEKLSEEIVGEVITLEEKINDLQNVLRGKIEATFSGITFGAKNKIEVIISFLAMLEMVKQRIINVEQGNLFKEIKLSVKETSTN
jgi:segregation and condensation protein A